MARDGLRSIVDDGRTALRRLRRSPGVSTLIVLSLALGVGANAAIFGVARAVLFPPVLYAEPDRVVEVELFSNNARVRLLEAHAVTVERLAPAFDRIEAYSTEAVHWHRGDSTVRLLARLVTPRLPCAMGVSIIAGRGFVEQDGASGAEPVALISEGLWRREFGAAADLSGRTLRLGDVHHAIVGVGRPARSDRAADLWLARTLDPSGSRAVTVVAWLGHGVPLAQAQAGLAHVSGALDRRSGASLELRLSRPGARENWTAIDRAMVLLWLASAFVLAIVGANISNLLLARNLARRRETATRVALGASRVRIGRPLVMESLVLGLIGGCAGVIVAAWGTAALLALRPRSLSLVYPESIPLDPVGVAYSLGLSMVAAILIGCLPALRAIGTDVLRGAGRDDSQVHGAISTRRLLAVAIAGQAALSLTLLVGAVLVANSLVRLSSAGPGFEAERIAELSVELEPSGDADAAARREFFHELTRRIAALPAAIDAATATDAPPHAVMMVSDIEIGGREGAPMPPVEASWVHVSANYFRVLGIPHLEGQPFPSHDRNFTSVVVSRSFARRYWAQGDAVGGRFRLQRQGTWGAWMHVAGVVGDVKGRGLRDAYDEIYLPYDAYRADRSTIVARTQGDPALLVPLMRRELWAVAPDVAVESSGTVRASMAQSIDEQPFYALLFGSFAVVAVALAVIGVFGVTSYAVSRRRREIGIRLALGAQTSDVKRMVALQGLTPTLIGILGGLAGSAALGRVMSSLVQGVEGSGLLYLAPAVALALVSAAATWVPARRATAVDVSSVLRD